MPVGINWATAMGRLVHPSVSDRRYPHTVHLAAPWFVTTSIMRNAKVPPLTRLPQEKVDSCPLEGLSVRELKRAVLADLEPAGWKTEREREKKTLRRPQ